MSATESNVRELSAQDRQKLDELLSDFHRTWEAGHLDRALLDLPLDVPYRLAAVTGLAAIDLELHWQHGHHVRVEEYLQTYPELGTADNVSIELLLAEFFSQERYETAPDLNAFLARFPQQAEDVRRLISLARSPRLSGQRTKPSGNTSIHSQAVEDGPALPEQFDRYRILKKLGHGGMGIVYLAFDTRLDRKVALKVPKFAPDNNAENLERFYREARATATITHPNLCPLYDVGEVDGTPYLTMAYIEGWPLSKFIRPDKLLPQFGVATVVRIVAQAIAEAHKRGVIHRDLKPGNIMINKRGEPIVMDFGLARWVNADKEDVRLTRSGAILGAPVYMSPEQVYGDVEAMGPGCDVYSLGVILYELLTARLPFEGPTTAVLAKTLIQPPKPPTAYRPDIDPRLEAICLKAMAKKINDRYATMTEFAAALTEYIRAERQAQTLTSLSQTAIPANGSSASLSGPLPRGSSTSNLRKKQAATNTLDGGESGMQTEVDDNLVEMADPMTLPLSSPSASAMRKPPPQRSRALLWAGLLGTAAVASLLIASVVGWVLLKPSPKPQPTTPAAAPEGLLLIALQNVPDDADIRLNDKVVERQDLSKPLPLKPGEHHIVVSANKFETWTKTFTVNEGENTPILVDLKPLATLKIVLPPTIPPEAKVFVNHAEIERSRLAAPLPVTPDKYVVEVSADQFEPWTQTVTVKRGDSAEVKVALLAKKPVVVPTLDHIVEARRFEASKQDIERVAVSKDGRYALTAGKDGTVRYWDLSKDHELRTINAHKGRVHYVVFAPDEHFALSCGKDMLACLWNLETGKLEKTFKGHTDEVWGALFTPDGKHVITCAGDKDMTAKLWDATMKEPKVLRTFEGHTKGINAIALSPDGTRLLTAGWDSTLRLWDVDNAMQLHSFEVKPGRYSSVAFLADGRRAVAATGHKVKIYDTIGRKELKSLDNGYSDKDSVWFVATSPGGHRILSGGSDGTICLWDADSGNLLERCTGHKGSVPGVVFTPDGKHFLSGSADSTLRLWDLPPKESDPPPMPAGE